MLLEIHQFIANILNRKRYLDLIRKGKKTCEIKSQRLKVPRRATHLLMCGNKAVRKLCREYWVARLMDRKALGPFFSGKEILEATVVKGKEFKTGMGEPELDEFIASKNSKRAYVYRFCDVREARDVTWEHCAANTNTGFLRPTMKDGSVRFDVRIEEELAAAPVAASIRASPAAASTQDKKPSSPSVKRVMQGPKVPRRAGVVRAVRAPVTPVDSGMIDLTAGLDHDEY